MRIREAFRYFWPNCKGVAALLARKPDAAAKDNPPAPLIDHVNLRGPGYYH
jgi:hypothetical protein